MAEPKSIEQRKKKVINGVTYVRDGSVMFPLDAVMEAGGDFNAVDPSLAKSWQGTINEEVAQGRRKSGNNLNGNWANAARAAGLQGLEGGWTKNNPELFKLAQNLVYGHAKFGKNGTFIGQRPNGYYVYDRSGQQISFNPGVAPPELFDADAQSNFQSTAGNDILAKGGALANQIRNPPVSSPMPSAPRDTAGLTQSITNIPVQNPSIPPSFSTAPTPTTRPHTTPLNTNPMPDRQTASNPMGVAGGGLTGGVGGSMVGSQAGGLTGPLPPTPNQTALKQRKYKYSTGSPLPPSPLNTATNPMGGY